MNNIFFLSGLPRSGSTLLGGILSQNQDIYVSPTSPLLDLFCRLDGDLTALDLFYSFDLKKVSENIYKNLASNFYENIDKKYIIDKHRGHPKNYLSLKKFVTDNPKIICLIRPISEIIASYIKLIESSNKENFLDNHILQKNLRISTENRAKVLWENYISDPYESTKIGLNKFREHILVLTYDQLVFETQEAIDSIYEFLKIPKFENHNFHDIKNYCVEKDHMWGIENLHNIRSVLKKTSIPAEEILGPYLTQHYNSFNF